MTRPIDPAQIAPDGYRLLIVEDDVDLSMRIKDLFEEHTGSKVVVAHSMEAANKAVLTDALVFDLVVMDVMLPETEERLEQIRESEEDIAKAGRILDELQENPPDDLARDRIAQARFDRAKAIGRIETLINRDGGIELVREWRESDLDAAKTVPILFLTAVGNDDAIRRGMELVGARGEWLTKPTTSSDLLRAAARLLSNPDAKG